MTPNPSLPGKQRCRIPLSLGRLPTRDPGHFLLEAVSGLDLILTTTEPNPD